MKLKIIKFPNPFLRKKAKAVKTFTPAIARLIDDMIETMHAAPGVGLAAPQVHKSIRLIVVDPGSGPLALVNPKVLEQSGCQVFTEGCLCLPGVEAPVERAAHVRVKAQDRDGAEFELSADGFPATILQHEIDHLDGVVFIDRVKNPGDIKYVPPAKEKKEELL